MADDNFAFSNAQAPVRQRGEGYGSSLDITDAVGIKNYIAEKVTDFETKEEGKHPWILKRYGSWYVSAHIGEFTVWWNMDENKKGGQYMPVADEAQGRRYLAWVASQLNSPESVEIWERAATAFEGYKAVNLTVAAKAAEIYHEGTALYWGDMDELPDGVSVGDVREPGKNWDDTVVNDKGNTVFANAKVRGAWMQKARNRMKLKSTNFYWDETVIEE